MVLETLIIQYTCKVILKPLKSSINTHTHKHTYTVPALKYFHNHVPQRWRHWGVGENGGIALGTHRDKRYI